jgi:hypothetical protein
MTRDTILSIKVDSAEAVRSIAEYSRKVEQLRKVEAELTKTIKEEGDKSGELRKQLVAFGEERKAYTRIIQEQSKEVQNNIKQSQDEVGSLKSLRAQLSNLTKQYDELGRARREGAEGEALQKQINAVTTELKDAEEATQRYYRNVGNYEGALQNMFGNTATRAGQAVNKMGNMAKAAGGVVPAVKAIGVAINASFGVWGLIIAAIVMAIQGLMKVITGSEGLMHSIKEAFTPIKWVFEGIKNAIQSVVEGVVRVTNYIKDFFVKVVKGVADLLEWVGADSLASSLNSIVNSYERLNDAVKEQNQLQIDRRELNKENAVRELEIAKLREKATDKMKYSAEQRLKFLKEANDLELAMSQKNKDIAKREYEAIKYLNSTSQSSTEALNKEAEAYVNMYKAQSAYLMKKKELNAQMTEANNQMLAEAKAVKDAIDKEWQSVFTIYDSLIDAQIDLMDEGLAKDLEKEWTRYERDMKKLQQQWYDSTKETRYAIEQNIEKTRDNHLKRVAAIEKKWAKKIADDTYNDEVALQNARIELMEDGQDKELAKEELRYRQSVQALRKRLNEEKNLTKAQRKAINEMIEVETQQHDKNMIAIRKAHIKKEVQLISEAERERLAILTEAERGLAEEWKSIEDDMYLSWENRVKQAQLQGGDYLALEVERKKFELDTLHKLEEESEEQFQSRMLDKQKEYREAQDALADARISKYEEIGSAIGALSGLVDAFGEDSKETAIASKAIALGEIAVQTGVALAKGISAAAAAGPFPANIAAIGTTIGTILGELASAVSIVKSAKFATGGYVSGPGTGTSDSIHAQLSNGESVLTAQATSMFSPILSPLNQMGGGVPIVATQTAAQVQGEDMLARAFAKGMQHANIRVGVDEITRVQNRVKVIERMGRL